MTYSAMAPSSSRRSTKRFECTAHSTREDDAIEPFDEWQVPKIQWDHKANPSCSCLRLSVNLLRRLNLALSIYRQRLQSHGYSYYFLTQGCQPPLMMTETSPSHEREPPPMEENEQAVYVIFQEREEDGVTSIRKKHQ